MKLRTASVLLLSCLLIASVGAGCIVTVENVINGGDKKDTGSEEDAASDATTGDTATPEDIATDAPSIQDVVAQEDIPAADVGPSDVFVEPDVVALDAAEDDVADEDVADEDVADEDDVAVEDANADDVMAGDVTQTDVWIQEDAEGDATPEALIEIAGSWETNWGDYFDIDNEYWGPSLMHAFDNDANWAITQYPEDDLWSPNLFTKSVWTEIAANGTFYQCTVVYDAQTFEEAAESEASADDADPANSGCGGFEWTLYVPVGGFP